MISVFIVSKDRPLFLASYLSTLMQARAEITVLYLATTFEYSAAYRSLEKIYSDVCFIRQTHTIREHMIDCMVSDANEYMIVSVDDNCYRHTDGRCFDKAVDRMDGSPDIFSYSLRVDVETDKCHVGKPGTVEANRIGDTVFYDYRESTGHWRNTFDCSSTVYRTEDIYGLATGNMFGSINEFETIGSRYFKPKLMAFSSDKPAMTNIHVDTWDRNQVGHLRQRVTNEQAFKLFEQGREIDIDATFAARDEQNTTHVMELYLK